MMTKTDEDYVVKETVKFLESEFSDYNTQVDSGEIVIGGCGVDSCNKKWRADIRAGVPALTSNQSYKGDLLIECKGAGGDIRKGVGQALLYRELGHKGGFAGFNLGSVHKDMLANLPLYTFNVGFNTTELISTPGSRDKDVVSLSKTVCLPDKLYNKVENMKREWGYDTEWEFINDAVRRRVDELSE